MRPILARSLIFFLILTGCTSTTHTRRHVTFQTPQTFGSRLIYQATKSAASTTFNLSSPSEKEVIGLARLKDLGTELLTDLGGIIIHLRTEDGGQIEGIYFDPAQYRAKQATAYKKWYNILKLPRNCRLAEIFESEFSGRSMCSLVSLPPKLPFHPIAKQKSIGVLVLPEYGLTFQLDPKIILNFLARGLHVFAINYRSHDHLPEWKSTCSDALTALTWLKLHLKSPDQDLIAFGKSFGTGPAIYLGTQHRDINLILERPFARMSDLCAYQQHGPLSSLTSPLAKSFIEKYFCYPNEDWIDKTRGKLLILESTSDEAIAGHAERLFCAKTAKFDEEEKRLFREKYWIQVQGSHFGRFWGDSSDTWYRNKTHQNQIDRFLKELK